MDKKVIVLADTDEEYISVLEYHVVETWGDDAQIEVITQPQYLDTFFNQAREIFLLVINEELYMDNVKIKKHNIHHLFLLSEDDLPQRDRVGENGLYLYKYSSVRDILLQIQRKVRTAFMSGTVSHTDVVLVYAVSGGVGKTLCSLGLCSALETSGKRVLYMNTEALQDFAMYVDDVSWMPSGFGYSMAMNDSAAVRDLSAAVGRCGFDYIKPFPKITLSYQITAKSYLYLLEQIRDTRRYDMIVVELPKDVDGQIMSFFDMADKVLMICDQSRQCAGKLDIFTQSLTIPTERYMFICNRFRKNEQNFLEDVFIIRQCSISAYIKEQGQPLTLGELVEADSLKAVTYMFD